MKRILWIALLVGCTDVSGFSGRWNGAVVSDPAILAGLAPQAEASLQIDAADRISLRGGLTVAGETVALRPMTRAANDTLGAVEWPDSPLRSYWMVAPLAAGDTTAVISLYGDDRVDLRLFRGDSLYALFHLKR